MADSTSDDGAVPAPETNAPRQRGIVGSGYVFGPLAASWVVGLSVSWFVGLRHRPEMVPFTVALYGCAIFFIHGYWLAWRAGTIIRRYAALILAIVVLIALAALHADDAEARLVWTIAGPGDRPAVPALFVAAAADLVAATLLLVHGVILGLGSRAARVIESALSIEEIDDAERIDDDGPGSLEVPTTKQNAASHPRG